MSHFKERKEKNCLNCNAVVYGRYCHLCSQENVEPKETFGHLVTHFIYDITHFDGKFFSSVKYLLFRPAFLSKEYIRGKRMSYLNPIKMYVFVSAFFFLFFFTVVKPVINVNDKGRSKTYAKVKANIEKRINDLEDALKERETPVFAKETMSNQLVLLQQDMNTLKKDTSNLSKLNYFKMEHSTIVSQEYKNIAYYDSVQQSLPKDKRDNWIKKTFQTKKIELDNKYGDNKTELIEKFLERFMHTFPQILFISLPLFALILKLLYVRKKSYFYADHIIYTVHLYCATFIFMFFLISLSKLGKLNHLQWLAGLIPIIGIYIIWYQYKSLRNFYEQRRAKTLLKFTLMYALSSMLMLVLFTVFIIFSLFAI